MTATTLPNRPPGPGRFLGNSTLFLVDVVAVLDLLGELSPAELDALIFPDEIATPALC
jgi:hypothetical protein